ncbi:hypothetical protein GC207_13605 [bacterium]|nr:hypothetical protein [bacterium]
MKKSVASGAARLAGKVREFIGRKSQRDLTRLLGRSAPKPARSRKGSLLRAPRYWQKWETALLGKVPDAEVARRTGRTYSAVQSQRVKQGILYVRQRDWTPDEIGLLGKYPDREVARMTRRTLAGVQTRRQDLKLPSVSSRQRDWTKREDALLVKYPDREVARRLKRSHASVQHRRQRLGIPKPNPLARSWSKLEDSLLGRLPDVVLSRQLNRTLAAVRFRRLDKKIPTCGCPPDQLPSAIAKLRGVLCRVQAEKQKARALPSIPVGRFRRSGRDSRPRKLRWWTAAEDKLLGTLSDGELARRLGRSTISVMRRRLRLGILLPVQSRLWTLEEDALVGAMPDRELAHKLNRTPAAVKIRRQRKGLPPFHHVQPKTPDKGVLRVTTGN